MTIKNLYLFSVIIVVSLVISSLVFAAGVCVRWDKNSDLHTNGYKVYYRSVSLENRVKNFSFEGVLADWTTSGNLGVANLSTFYPAQHGDNTLVFNWGQNEPNGAISQQITTTPGQTYQIIFKIGVLSYAVGEQRLLVRIKGLTQINNSLLETVVLTGNGGGETHWEEHIFNFTANDTDMAVYFQDVSPATFNIDMMLDNIRIDIINPPEPTTVPTAVDFNSVAVNNLVVGQKYYFYVTTINTVGLESLPSNEISTIASNDAIFKVVSDIARLPNGNFGFVVTSPPDPTALVRILYSDDNIYWRALGTIVNPTGNVHIEDVNSPPMPLIRFYQIDRATTSLENGSARPARPPKPRQK